MDSENLSPRDSILIGIIALLLGVALVYFVFQPSIMNRNIIKISIAEEGTKVVSFDDFSVLPGEEAEYAFRFDEVDVSPYDVSLQFKTDMDVSPYDFIYVRIVVDGKVLQDKPLITALKEDPVYLHIEPVKDGEVDVKIVYYIPVDVGNEAQNVALSFDLIVTATTQGEAKEVVG